MRLWNGPGAAGLLGIRGPLEDAVGPYGLAALNALRPARGERALDVGCGLGATTRELARRVGPAGAAVGIDFSRPYLDLAREESGPLGNVTYLLADAQTHPFTAEFDLLYSRFGLMFFEDPPAAFGNLRRALRRQGRLSAVVWGPAAACSWVDLPLRALEAQLKAAVRPPSRGPGPFSLSDVTALVGLLCDAGFAAVRVEPVDLPLHCGDTPADAASFLLRFGPAGAALREAGKKGTVSDARWRLP